MSAAASQAMTGGEEFNASERESSTTSDEMSRN